MSQSILLTKEDNIITHILPNGKLIIYNNQLYIGNQSGVSSTSYTTTKIAGNIDLSQVEVNEGYKYKDIFTLQREVYHTVFIIGRVTLPNSGMNCSVEIRNTPSPSAIAKFIISPIRPNALFFCIFNVDEEIGFSAYKLNSISTMSQVTKINSDFYICVRVPSSTSTNNLSYDVTIINLT